MESCPQVGSSSKIGHDLPLGFDERQGIEVTKA